MRVRLPSVTFVFVMLFVLLAIVARALSVGTSRALFDASLSRDVYMAGAIGGSAVLLVSILLLSQRLSWLDDRLDAVSLRLGRASADGAKLRIDPGPQLRRGNAAPDQPAPLTASQVLDSPGRAVRETPPTGSGTSTVAHPDPNPSSPNWPEVYGRLVWIRRVIRVYYGGPVVVSLLFVAISVTMLPGVQGFASSAFRLNTMMVLFLSFGWCILVAWILILSITLRPPHRRRRR